MRRENQIALEAHLEEVLQALPAGHKPDHSTAGALHAIAQLPPPYGYYLAYLIAGHHCGLQDWGDLEIRLNKPEKQARYAQTLQAAQEMVGADLLLGLPTHLTSQRPRVGPQKMAKSLDLSLWLRLLFSALIDADRLDSERFGDPQAAARRGGAPSIPTLCERLDAFIAERFGDYEAPPPVDTPVNRLRMQILAQCWRHAAWEPGLFRLTVPTGGGKTISSLAFALHHARQFGLERVIVVIPYTSIIEQTAAQLRAILGDEAVLEHHSQFDPERDTPESLLASENWDAPVIVTTNVQFFESLFAAKTSKARKIHRVVRSVVVLDEAQQVSPEFLDPILQTLGALSRHYQTSVVFCTATQPAFEQRDDFPEGLTDMRELMVDPSPSALAHALQRVTVTLPNNLNLPTEWETLAAQVSQYPQVLCIVDRRRACRTLHSLMPPETIHLSALMCGAHRSQVIAEIRRRLQAEEPVQVISTQLVEAGVDLDFPVVFRALAGLDSLAQAAGRCNREGRLVEGRFIVFAPPDEPPSHLLRLARQAAQETLATMAENPDPFSPEVMNRYFRQFLWQVKHDAHGILKLLQPDRVGSHRVGIQFRSAADAFQLIDTGPMLPVVVRYGEGADWVDRLLAGHPPTRAVRRTLQRYTINLSVREHRKLLSQGDLAEAHPGLYVQRVDGLYDERLGWTEDTSEAMLLV